MVYARYIHSNHPVRPANTIEVYKEGPRGCVRDLSVNASEKRTIDLISPDIDLPQVPVTSRQCPWQPGGDVP